MDLLKSTPGAALPNFGMGSGGIIKRDNIPAFSSGGGGVKSGSIPSFSGGGGSSADNLGAGLSGNSFLASRRARFAEEMKNDPTLKRDLAAMQLTEGASGGSTIESMMNRADMRGWTLRQALGYSADGKVNPKSFYGTNPSR